MFSLGTPMAVHGITGEKKMKAGTLSIKNSILLREALNLTDIDALHHALAKVFKGHAWVLSRKARFCFTYIASRIARTGSDPKDPPAAISTCGCGESSAEVCSRLLARLCEAGLLVPVDTTYVFCRRKEDKKYNRACTYRAHPVFREFLRRHIQLLTALDDEDNPLNPLRIAKQSAGRTRGLAMYQAKKVYARQRKEWRTITKKDTALWEILHREGWLKCTNVNLDERFDERYVEKAVHDNYNVHPVKKRVLRTDKTAKLPPPYWTNFKVNAKPDPKTKYHIITKIGCRPGNALCQTRNEEHSDERLKILHELGIDAQHIDVKSSIGNVVRAMKTGVFTPFEDCYSAIGRHLYVDWDLMDADTRAKKRKLIKKSYMKCNFGAFAAAAAMYPDGKRARSYVGDTDKEFTYGEMQSAMRKAGIEPAGEDTSVFLYEGCIYGIARSILIEEYGIRSICVYDSFYLDKKIDNDTFTKILNKALHQYLDILRKKDKK